MFSFHKPKIYRSMQGCCICRAKSSSSRFTDSKRYESDFIKCFEILERRSGEICNACVLLVKRWKKLPVGSNRNWHHVVDARAGPGTKSMNKIKNKAKMEEKLLKKKHKHKHKKPKMVKPARSSGGLSDDVADDFLSDRSSHSGYISNSDGSDDEQGSTTRSKGSSGKRSGTGRRRKQANPLQFSSFLDLTYWKKTEVCCGIIFEGANGEVMVDKSLLRPCTTCKTRKTTPTSEPASTALTVDTPVPQATAAVAAAAAAVAAVAKQDPLRCNEEEEEDDDDDDLLDDIMDEDDLDDEDLMDEDDDEGLDSGIGSQEISTAEGSPQPVATSSSSSNSASLSDIAAVAAAAAATVVLPTSTLLDATSSSTSSSLMNHSATPTPAAAVAGPRCIQMEV